MAAIREQPLGVLQIQAWARRGRLYAVIDATDTPAVVARAREAGDDQAVSLYRGRAEEEWYAIAPYLFRVDPPILEWIAAELWSKPWGIFALADVSLDDLRLHFRRFLTVEAPNGESWYFRFYDPRVLPKFLATCTEGELTEFLGPVRAFAVTDQESYGVKVLAPGSPLTTTLPPGRQPVIVRA
jgi:hypothetical protein